MGPVNPLVMAGNTAAGGDDSVERLKLELELMREQLEVMKEQTRLEERKGKTRRAEIKARTREVETREATKQAALRNSEQDRLFNCKPFNPTPYIYTSFAF